MVVVLCRIITSIYCSIIKKQAVVEISEHANENKLWDAFFFFFNIILIRIEKPREVCSSTWIRHPSFSDEFGEEDAKTPDVRFNGEAPVKCSFRSRPLDGELCPCNHGNRVKIHGDRNILGYIEK